VGELGVGKAGLLHLEQGVGCTIVPAEAAVGEIWAIKSALP
jgi:hypothetical protein